MCEGIRVVGVATLPNAVCVASGNMLDLLPRRVPVFKLSVGMIPKPAWPFVERTVRSTGKKTTVGRDTSEWSPAAIGCRIMRICCNRAIRLKIINLLRHVDNVL